MLALSLARRLITQVPCQCQIGTWRAVFALPLPVLARRVQIPGSWFACQIVTGGAPPRPPGCCRSRGAAGRLRPPGLARPLLLGRALVLAGLGRLLVCQHG